MVPLRARLLPFLALLALAAIAASTQAANHNDGSGDVTWSLDSSCNRVSLTISAVAWDPAWKDVIVSYDSFAKDTRHVNRHLVDASPRREEFKRADFTLPFTRTMPVPMDASPYRVLVTFGERLTESTFEDMAIRTLDVAMDTPTAGDYDCDGLADGSDPCVELYGTAADANANGAGDACDPYGDSECGRWDVAYSPGGGMTATIDEASKTLSWDWLDPVCNYLAPTVPTWNNLHKVEATRYGQRTNSDAALGTGTTRALPLQWCTRYQAQVETKDAVNEALYGRNVAEAFWTERGDNKNARAFPFTDTTTPTKPPNAPWVDAGYQPDYRASTHSARLAWNIDQNDCRPTRYVVETTIGAYHKSYTVPVGEHSLTAGVDLEPVGDCELVDIRVTPHNSVGAGTPLLMSWRAPSSAGEYTGPPTDVTLSVDSHDAASHRYLLRISAMPNCGERLELHRVDGTFPQKIADWPSNSLTLYVYEPICRDGIFQTFGVTMHEWRGSNPVDLAGSTDNYADSPQHPCDFYSSASACDMEWYNAHTAPYAPIRALPLSGRHPAPSPSWTLDWANDGCNYKHVIGYHDLTADPDSHAPWTFLGIYYDHFIPAGKVGHGTGSWALHEGLLACHQYEYSTLTYKPDEAWTYDTMSPGDDIPYYWLPGTPRLLKAYHWIPEAVGLFSGTVAREGSDLRITLSFAQENSANCADYHPTVYSSTNPAGPYSAGWGFSILDYTETYTDGVVSGYSIKVPGWSLVPCQTRYLKVGVGNNPAVPPYTYSMTAFTTDHLQVTVPDDSAPVGLTASYDAGLNQATLSWAAGSACPERYDVEYNLASEGAWYPLGSTTGTSLTHPGLVACGAYSYRVTSHNGGGGSGTSGVVGVTAAPQAPSAPGGVTATLGASGGVHVAWAAATPAGDCAIDQYRVYRGTSPDPFHTGTVIATVPGTVTSCEDTLPNPSDATNYYQVVAVTAGLDSDPSETATFHMDTPAPLPVPLPPLPLTVPPVVVPPVPVSLGG
ncbi:MAG: hypothetical protein QOD77_1456 [Thermoplasmata archaeon]|nr:hypothetical protein [Thermoplasmata archaeon]